MWIQPCTFFKSNSKRQSMKNSKNKSKLSNYPKTLLFVSMGMQKLTGKHYSHWQNVFDKYFIMHNMYYAKNSIYSFLLVASRKNIRHTKSHTANFNNTIFAAFAFRNSNFWIDIQTKHGIKKPIFTDEYKQINSLKYKKTELTLQDTLKTKWWFLQNRAICKNMDCCFEYV